MLCGIGRLERQTKGWKRMIGLVAKTCPLRATSRVLVNEVASYYVDDQVRRTFGAKAS